mmetsp:Transcript_19422/g.25092  ORF Transcript_19422/g.25092 Transcript_19422/m.25092 type:complete len:303 (+) Transcript_19422:2739-3647(+)
MGDPHPCRWGWCLGAFSCWLGSTNTRRKRGRGCLPASTSWVWWLWSSLGCSFAGRCLMLWTEFSGCSLVVKYPVLLLRLRRCWPTNSTSSLCGWCPGTPLGISSSSSSPSHQVARRQACISIFWPAFGFRLRHRTTFLRGLGSGCFGRALRACLGLFRGRAVGFWSMFALSSHCLKLLRRGPVLRLAAHHTPSLILVLPNMCSGTVIRECLLVTTPSNISIGWIGLCHTLLTPGFTGRGISRCNWQNSFVPLHFGADTQRIQRGLAKGALPPLFFLLPAGRQVVGISIAVIVAAGGGIHIAV